MVNIENFIEIKYRELQSEINDEFVFLYESVNDKKLRSIFSTLHYILIMMFDVMNQRLPTQDQTNHFWADPSRQLIRAIDIIMDLKKGLKDSSYAFEIEEYYINLMLTTRKFLNNTGGSEIPAHMNKVELYYTVPIFVICNIISIEDEGGRRNSQLKLIGEGSYANVFRFKDNFYKSHFVLKRAKDNLDGKELLRFKREFEQMKGFNSPYIVSVYCYNEVLNEYIMESMDCSIYEYIEKNNNKLSNAQRKNLVNQLLRAFQYIHSKGVLHRDIGPKNILLKLYEDVCVVKVADFGLVKIPDSTLTDVNTEFKGSFNDPGLMIKGFDNYSILHETYALTRLIYYIMTGRTKIEYIKDYKLRELIDKGLALDENIRYHSVEDLSAVFREV